MLSSGTGLLSIFAAKAGASRVYCCESSVALATIAERCIQDNGFADVVKVIKKHSTALEVGSGKDLDERVDVIVTELVDSGLLGEHIISTLRDARKRLLRSEGTIIPHAANVYCVPIESAQIAARQVVALPTTSNHSYPLARTSADIAWSKVGCYRRLCIDEHYSCETLSPPFEHKKLCHPIKVLQVPLDGKTDSRWWRGPPGKDRTTTASGAAGAVKEGMVDPEITSFTCTSAGAVDAIAYWFDMELLEPEAAAATTTTAAVAMPVDKSVAMTGDVVLEETSALEAKEEEKNKVKTTPTSFVNLT